MATRNPTHVQIDDIWIDVSISETHGVGAEVTDHPVELGANIADHIRPTPRTLSIEGLVTNHPIELPGSHIGSSKLSTSQVTISAASSVPRRVPPQSVTIEGEPSIGLYGMLPGADQAVAILGALRLEVRSKRQFSAEHNRVETKTETASRTQYAAQVVHFTEPFNRVEAVHAALVNIIESRKLVSIVTGLIRYDSVALTDVQFERSAQVGKDALKFTAQARVLRIVQSEVVKLPDPVQPRAKPSLSEGKQAPQKTNPATVPVPQQSGASKIGETIVEGVRSLLGR